MGLVTKCVWPAVTLIVVVAAALIYVFYPPVCKSSDAEGYGPTPVPPSPVTPTSPVGPRDPWEVDYRIPNTSYPETYEVLMHPDLSVGLFTGRVRIELAVTQPARYLLLNIDGINVTKTSLAAADGSQVPLQECFEYKPNQFWVILLQDQLPPGMYRLELEFGGSLTRDIVGVYMSAYVDESTAKTSRESPEVESPWENNYKLLDHVIPEEYNLILHPNLKEGTFSGVVDVTIKVTAPTDYIPIHHKDLKITNSVFKASKESSNLVKNAFNYPKNEFWIIQLSQVVSSGIFNLKLDFSGSLTNDIVGFYRSSYKDVYSGESRNIATTKFEPTYARRAFPCFDEPSFKAKYNVSLVRPSKGNYIALSNMNQVGETHDSPSPGLTTVQFATSVPMSTYLACFIVCDFEHLPPLKSKRGFDVNVYARSGQIQKMEYALQIAASTIDFYIDYFGINYPLPKLDLIAIPDFVSGAMENWGLITFRETSVLYDSNFSSAGNHLGVTLTVTHELAHMWFGDLVTMKWWDDLWLNEGFATFIEFKGTAHNHPDWDVDTVFLIHDLVDALGLDSTMSSHPIIKHVSHPDQITEIFDRISYAKGASVIRMLEGFMGADKFRQGVVSYLKTFQYKNAETKDLWHHLQLFADVNIERVMDTWTRQMGFPLLNVARTGNTLTITQQRLTADKNASYDPNESIYKYKWDVPVTYITSENKESTLKWLLLENPQLTIDIGNVEWYKLNYHFVGYYRVNYPQEHWAVLTNVLKNDIKAFDAADRANILDDAFTLAESGHLDYSTALAVTSFLSQEDHFVVWAIASQHLLSIDSHLMFTPAYSDYRKYLRKLITPQYSDSLWNFPPDASFLQRGLQVRMISLGCRTGVSACLSKAKQLFTDWLENNGPKPHVEIRNIVYSYGMAESGEEQWDKLWDLYLAETDPQEKVKLRGALCAVKEPWILARLIERAKNEDYVRSQDFFILLGSIASNPVGNSIMWDWTRANWQYLVDRFTLNNRMFGRLLPSVVGSFSTEVKLKEVQTFLAQNPEEGAGGSGRKAAIEAINLNILWLEQHLPALTTWLETATA